MTRTPADETVPDKVFDNPLIRASKARRSDRVFFFLGAIAAVWLSVAIVRLDFRVSVWAPFVLVPLWLVVAYLALPRINRILTAIYVPDYFIGRTRTSDGLLGDPLNLAFRGTPEQVSTAMERAGWVRADPITARTSWGIVRATLTRRSYPEAPVSPLFLFGRQQDAAYQQEVDGHPTQRHHVRLWRTPKGWPLPGGERVDWLAAGTYDRAVGLSFFTLQVTHRIDADIDIERDYIVSSITDVEPEVTVDVLEDFTTSYHSRNGGGDTIRTDGDLPVVQLGAVVPRADAAVLEPDQPGGAPMQVWFPVVVNLVTIPLLALDLLTSTSDSDSLTNVGSSIAWAGIVALLSFAVLRRHQWARVVLLVLSTLSLAVQVAIYQSVDRAGDQALWLVQAAIGVLMLVALSSPAAAEWTGRPAPEQP